MNTKIHSSRPDAAARHKLSRMANDTQLDRRVRQKAANLLLRSSVPCSVSAAEVKAFIQELVSELETKAC